MARINVIGAINESDFGFQNKKSCCKHHEEKECCCPEFLKFDFFFCDVKIINKNAKCEEDKHKNY
ncbi:hypothetical protein [Alkaliphilus sp. B6464]|uniref:hypothetical protein n=1 Tax=Alkaliphilus sp. B6464 TaxID=2731219 RepID=UPI001BAE4C87|nr:hypothetical protein [Alkaliphilus sp. B6464]QUH20004.1 hypothetical protein HYG84_08880 [Alkaliphilus sp. B6464]